MKVLNKNIEMIATTSKEAGIQGLNPVRCRLEENDELIVIPIVRIMKRDKEKICGEMVFKYTCMVNVNNTEKIAEIRYNINTMIWSLWKI